MREILFKAKKIKDKEWIEGYFAVHPSGDCSISVILDKCRKAPDGDPMWQKVLISHEVDPSTICQFTGLTDKNGNKIWENDICDRKEIYPEIVKYINGDFVLDYSHAFGKETGNSYCNLGFYVCERKCVEVIGNIFDNPELVS